MSGAEPPLLSWRHRTGVGEPRQGEEGRRLCGDLNMIVAEVALVSLKLVGAGETVLQAPLAGK